MLINSEYQATYLRLSDAARAALDQLAEQERREAVGFLDQSLLGKLLRAATHLIEHNHDRLIVDLMVIQAADYASRKIKERLLPRPKRGRKVHKWWTRKRDAELLDKYRPMVASLGKTNMALAFAKAHPSYDSPARVRRLPGEGAKEWGERESKNYDQQAKSIVAHFNKLLKAETQRENDALWRSDVNNIFASGIFSDLLD